MRPDPHKGGSLHLRGHLHQHVVTPLVGVRLRKNRTRTLLPSICCM